MKKPRTTTNIDLKLACTTGHDAAVMLLCGNIHRREEYDEMSLTCPVCQRTCVLSLNPRRVVTTFFGSDLVSS